MGNTLSVYSHLVIPFDCVITTDRGKRLEVLLLFMITMFRFRTGCLTSIIHGSIGINSTRLCAKTIPVSLFCVSDAGLKSEPHYVQTYINWWTTLLGCTSFLLLQLSHCGAVNFYCISYNYAAFVKQSSNHLCQSYGISGVYLKIVFWWCVCQYQRCKKLQMLQICLCYFFQLVLIFGPFWVIFGLFWVISGHFWAIFWC